MSKFSPILAKLLSQENLTVMQANVPTACFDVKDRVLLIPNLLPKYEGAYGMLTAHEVGHALFTTPAFNDIFLKAHKTMRQYYNVCEDVRVEKLIKRKYPGLRRVMAEGYEVFNSNNFFLPANIDVNSLTFIDRINSYFKIGHICGVQFTPQERLLVEEVESAETVAEVVTVSHKIYEFAKAQLTKPKEKPETQKPKSKKKDEKSDKSEKDEDGSGDEGNNAPSDKQTDEKSDKGDADKGDADRGDADKGDADKGDADRGDADKGEFTEDNGAGRTGSGSFDKPDMTDEEIEKALESLTQQLLDGGLKQAADVKSKVKNFSLETKFAADPVYSYKTILKNLTDESMYEYSTIGEHVNRFSSEFDKFVGTTNRLAAHMVKEFEMKKRAHQLRRSQTAKTGRLDVNKLFAYKIKDELFKNITVTSDDKNHGMIFLVDWSGSMNIHMNDTLRQMMSLAMFCRKAKIPFTVLAFSDRVFEEDVRNYNGQTNCNILRESHLRIQKNDVLLSDAGYGMQLLELMSDKMNEREFTRMMKLMHSGVLHGMYRLSGTPLNQALVYMHSYVSLYKKMNNIEKLTFVVLTDGQGESLYSTTNNGKTVYMGYGAHMMNVVDPITKDVYRIDSNNTTRMLLTMIGKAASCQVIGFYVCSTHDIQGALARNCQDDYDYTHAQDAKLDFRKNGYHVISNCGYEKLYLVNANDLKSIEYVPKYNETMSASNIAREMAKHTSALASNKMLMGKIVSEFSIGLTA